MSTGVFNPASVSALLSVVVTTIAAACAYLLGRVPDWDDVRPLTWVALTAAAAAGCNFTSTLDLSADVYLWTGRLQVAAVALHVLAWHAYLPGWARRPLGRRHRAALWGLVGVALLALWPGVVYGGAVTARPLPWLGVVYHDPALTPGGLAVYAVIGAYGLWGIGLVVRLGRAGAPLPRAHLACTLTILAMTLHDALVVGGLPLPTPYLLDFGFYGPISMLGLITIQRVGQSAVDLRHLNAGLAGLVAQRSSELERSQVALARAERLAALGQFAAGVAHEVNNPAAVVASSLDVLAGELADDPRDLLWSSLRDAQAGVGRIVAVVRQLQVAGRTASRPDQPLEPVQLAAALAAARPKASPLVTVDARVPPALHGLAQADSLVQVLSTLLAMALQAFPGGRRGAVSVTAAEDGELVRLVIEDDGVGLSEETLAHLLEPFHHSRPDRLGTGLELAVTHGLVTGMRGQLRFESELGRGTRATLELRRAPAPAGPTGPGAPPAAAPPARARLLIVDDDELVRSSMARLLGRSHDVRVADGIWSGLAELDAGAVDLVLCDVMMPGGGAERFWSELPLRAPWAMGRVAFMTGGAATPEARAFLAAQPQPILAKPFDASAVLEVLAELAEARSRAGPHPHPPGPDGTTPRRVGRLRR